MPIFLLKLKRSCIIKPVFGVFIAFVFILCLTACFDDKTAEKKDVAVKINDVLITLEEFNELIKFEAYADPEMELTAEAREQFVDYLINKELMIQEAVRLKLDRDENFVRTIEKYWESTLIHSLLNKKSEELKKKVLITEEEIKNYYSENKVEFDQPYKEVKDSIRIILEKDALEKELEKWNKSLKDSADITVNKALFDQKLR